MALQSVTVHVPDALYSHIKERAERSHRSIEDEVLNVLSSAVSGLPALPDDLADTLAQLATLNDDDLRRAARSRLPVAVSVELENLHLKRQRVGLTEAEVQALASMMRQYERAMLIRAEAAALLKQRGHDVSSLLEE